MAVSIRRSLRFAHSELVVTFTERADGDFGAGSDGLDLRRRRIAPEPWTVLAQVHGSRVLAVAGAGELTGEQGDAAVTGMTDCPIAMQTADCAPVILYSSTAIGVAHAGWRGLVAGVLANTASAVRSVGGDDSVRAIIGPCIHPLCYEFGALDLGKIVEIFGPSVAGKSEHGAPALDLPAAVKAALKLADVDLDVDLGRCTAADHRYFSYRARGEPQRMSAVAVMRRKAVTTVRQGEN